MKYCIIIPDGCADLPLKDLGSLTCLEYAYTPNMDKIAQSAFIGQVQTIPPSLTPGSDVATLSLLGFDPEKYYTGRSPLEVVSMGVDLKDTQMSFRCNLVYIENNIMKDYSAGHISTSEAEEIIENLNKEIDIPGIRFYTGVSYRHAMVIDNTDIEAICTPPHDISDKDIDDYLPKGKGSELLIRIMEKARPIVSKISNKANNIWLWGGGKRPSLPSFYSVFNVKAGMISAVDLLRGIAKYLEIDIIEVPGITGYIDTNFKGKGEEGARRLNDLDLVVIHIEAPDEAGHRGDVNAKITAIEKIDSEVLPPVLSLAEERGDIRIMILSDHTTPILTKTHGREPVPFMIYGPNVNPNSPCKFSEREAQKGEFISYGPSLIKNFLSPEIK